MAGITLLDYGMCNMLNVARAFEHVGAQLTITEDPAQVRAADRLVVPGVGAFSNSMQELNRRGHADAIRDFVATGRPMLGICVGMQVLFEGSEEFGDTEGLGLLPGWVRAVPDKTVDGVPQRVPHIGWDHLLQPERTNRLWTGTFLEPLEQTNPAVYFVHSFCAVPTDRGDILAECDYGGHRLCAAVARDNVVATQFHPERSGEAGLRALRHFVEV
jgi:imidazole glycerol-phosphate synthase subunit HisH